MHLIFERSRGRFKSNCNILALAWTPYYDETKFRLALFAYHQRQLINLTSSLAAANAGSQASGGVDSVPSEQPSGALARGLQANNNRRRHQHHHPPSTDNPADQPSEPAQSGSNQDAGSQHQHQVSPLNNARLGELRQRHRCLKEAKSSSSSSEENKKTKAKTGSEMMEELEARYGRMRDFGWLVVGNVGKIVGVTLTSTASPHPLAEADEDKDTSKEVDLMEFNDNDDADNQNDQTQKAASSQERPDRPAARTNFNLRGNLDEIILVRWNELYQKLATVDSKGNVLIWCKINDKFTIQTPFYNRTKSVADFKWSNDGKTALICYTDSFILVGSSSGQRHWHSMLNLDDYHITCAAWSPNDDQLLLAVSNGNLVVIDLPHSELTELVVNRTNIRTMCWSTSDMSLRHLSPESLVAAGPPRSASETARMEDTRRNSGGANVVNHRRLSRDCSIFSRYRLCPQVASGNQSATYSQQRASQRNILAIDLANNTIKLYDGGLDDPEPRTIQVRQESYIMHWSGDGQVLAVAGFNIHTTAPSVGCLRCRYLNEIKFYDQRGRLLHKQTLKYTRYPITAFTWAHDDTRLFVATGPRLHCAKVYRGVPSLSLLALSCFQRNTRLPDKMDILEGIIKQPAASGLPLVASNLVAWQSSNCPINLSTKQQLKPPKNRMDDDRDDGQPTTTTVCNNTNVYLYRLPLKLKLKIDELFNLTLRQPFDERWSLGDVVWHVPKRDQRHYCTLVCYDSDPDLAATTNGHQYKTHGGGRHSAAAGGGGGGSNGGGGRLAGDKAASENKVFVLYVEFQGSLVPILRARRVGFLKPEFVIFDPEDGLASRQAQRLRKVSDMSQQSSSAASFRRHHPHQHQAIDKPPLDYGKLVCDGSEDLADYPEAAFASSGMNLSFYYNCGETLATDASNHYQQGPCADLHADAAAMMMPDGCLSDPRRASSQFSDAEHYYNFDEPPTSSLAGKRMSDLISSRSYHQEPIALPPTGATNPLLYYMLNSSTAAAAGCGQPTGGGKLTRAERMRMRAQQQAQQGACLTENTEMVRIKSNIWGTKFKLIASGKGQGGLSTHSSRRFRSRSVLASVVYKASILHLQPRQIFLNIKNMSNYCCLCSRHHHSRLEREKPPTRRPSLLDESGSGSGSQRQHMSLLDMPNLEPLVTSSSRRSNHRHHHHHHHQRSASEATTSYRHQSQERILLPVGDSLRVVPKLEQNQHYKMATPSTSRKVPSLFTPTSREEEAPSLAHREQSATKRTKSNRATSNKSLIMAASNQQSPARDNQKLAKEPMPSTSSSSQQYAQDDILTLSLEQGDQIRVEMSTLSLAAKQKELSLMKRDENEKMDQFLATNKTLKSIQTITQMIVDLSSKADTEEEQVDFSSPSKLVKLEASGEQPTSAKSPAAASRYVAPDTPVHRPKRRTLAASRLLGELDHRADSSPSYQLTQSANTTPVSRRHHHHNQLQQRRRRQSAANSERTRGGGGHHHEPPMAPLPPPPPPVPMSRRLSSSAKRLLDGSLRSIYGSHAHSGASASDLDGEDHEPLVSRSLRARAPKPSFTQDLKQRLMGGGSSCHVPAAQSQPCTPTLGRIKKQHSDLSSLRTQLVQRLRRQKSPTSRQRYGRCNAGGLDDAASSSCSSSSSGSSSPSSSSSFESLADTELPPSSRRGHIFDLSRASDHKTKLRNTRGAQSSSVRDLRETGHNKRSDASSGDNNGNSHSRRRRGRKSQHQRRRKSLCQEANCCCAKEFKLNNRPPVWNELSQVYQLDFGGRVTQESAKNLQIDFEGKLALQFGRIDRCTYTLDYKYPFNAVQAMAIALASLTQRLK